MIKLSKRKMFLFGRYSLALLLPKKWLTEMAANAGDIVTVKYEKEKRQVIVYFKKHPKVDSKPKEKSDKRSDGFEPIPQI